MKTLLIYSLLLAVLFGNSGAGCGSKTEDPQPDEFLSLLGKWQFIRFTQSQVKSNGSVASDMWLAKEQGIDLVWEFSSNGVFKSYGNAAKGYSEQTGNWSLTVTKLDGKHIEEGKLIITGPATEDLAKVLGVEKVIYYISANTNYATGVSYLSADVDATNISPTKLTTTFSYDFEKK